MKPFASAARPALRIFVDAPLAAGRTLALPSGPARHVQVLRLQPGDTVTVFNGRASLEWPARILRIGRQAVEVELGDALEADREPKVAVTLAVGVPANDRMDGLIEKAGELGAAAIQPLVCERSVLRVAEDRAEAKQRHWRAVAAAASEQCGRTRVTAVLPVRPLLAWLDAEAEAARPDDGAARDIVLSLDAAACSPAAVLADGPRAVRVLSGPEGGLTPAEEHAAVARGFMPVGLGPRVLRADTAPLAVLAWLGLQDAKGGE
ncbi:MAG TPA: 16S rRNA (uracil(1498)-N(3))-methyltransferase [Caldimonas sp.]|jgi:16S rRNA (uracil1498-N3)-methyltransferase|nr:16S rRNA (uracil(1498)-N(3))-methyltransferase [Caldimonas sp.]HEX2540914.1 16S rRNA (uracil(1498)-N(3))-methyltransferase [Caldimonas sp.]